ncbi:MAG: galactose-1-epimerase [Spirochaetes bacterium]|nr:MAG: galactose-1-epimerase [Spirochaetota bacterium]
MTIKKQPFGTTPDGDTATLWTIENTSGLSLGICDWGATIVSVKQPDKAGRLDEIILGFDDASRYLSTEGYLGATCGRFANRIASGKFSLGGKEYQLNCNDGPNHLHGGEKGYNARTWEAAPYSEGNRSGVVFTLISPDGEENYPGELRISADYALDEQGRLFMDFKGVSNKPTIINITNHAYWNLAGAGSGSILNHLLKVHASGYLPVDETAIPTGEILSVEGTAFDFRDVKPISREFDHCMVIDGENGELRVAVEVRDPVSGRKLTLYTDRPGVQLYTGNFLQGTPFQKNGGFCLEPQDFPDAPNRPGFPPVVLQPGETYHHRSMIEFSNQ